MPTCIGVTSAQVRTLHCEGRHSVRRWEENCHVFFFFFFFFYFNFNSNKILAQKKILTQNVSCFHLSHCWTLLLGHQKYSETPNSRSHQKFGIKCLWYLSRSHPNCMSLWLSFSFRRTWGLVTQFPPADPIPDEGVYQHVRVQQKIRYSSDSEYSSSYWRQHYSQSNFAVNWSLLPDPRLQLTGHGRERVKKLR